VESWCLLAGGLKSKAQWPIDTITLRFSLMVFIHVCVSADTLVYQPPNGTTYTEGVLLPFIRKLIALRAHTQREIAVTVLLTSGALIAPGQTVATSLHGVKVASEIPADADLFLSCDQYLVDGAFLRGIPSALVQDGAAFADSGSGLKVAFDGDGVLCDRSSEERYRNIQALAKKTATSPQYFETEWNERHIPLGAGPMARIAQKLSLLRDELLEKYGAPCNLLQVILCTARNGRALSRMTNSTDALGIFFDRVLAVGHDRKADFLNVPKVHLFLDDIQSHLDIAKQSIACAKVPELVFIDCQSTEASAS
jgi:5'-nucleotidase